MTKGPAKILVVEDDIDYQELVAVMLAQHAVTVCASAEEAIAKLDAETFDIVISDINMNGMTGLELLGKMQREGKSESCPVILCSGQSDPTTRDAVMELGAAGFLVKPYPIDSLKNLVITLLASQPK
jgi:two-component system response regulator FlrC